MSNIISVPTWDINLADKGAIWITVNETSDTWAAKSATSLKRHNPGVSTLLFTDQDCNHDCFDYMVRIPSRSNDPLLSNKTQYPNQGIIAKSTYIDKSPFKHTVFLDMDTFICDPIPELFDALVDFNFDIGIAIDEGAMKINRPGIPECFPRFNTGVVAYRKSDATRRMFDNFWKLFISDDYTMNEECPFSAAVYSTPGLRLWTLPPEYDCRFIFPYILRHKAKILHGRDDNYPALAAKINSQDGCSRVMYNGDMIASYEPNIGFRKF